jgi:hypothetical protein
MEHHWNETDRENRSTREKTCPSATLSTTNSTRTDRGSNRGIRVERPATNRLNHGTAYYYNNMYHHQLVYKIKTKYVENLTRVPTSSGEHTEHLKVALKLGLCTFKCSVCSPEDVGTLVKFSTHFVLTLCTSW